MKKDKILNSVLAEMAGQGVMPWGVVAGEYKRQKGKGKLGQLIHDYARAWPHRIKITHGYNVSAGWDVEIVPVALTDASG